MDLTETLSATAPALTGTTAVGALLGRGARFGPRCATRLTGYMSSEMNRFCCSVSGFQKIDGHVATNIGTATHSAPPPGEHVAKNSAAQNVTERIENVRDVVEMGCAARSF